MISSSPRFFVALTLVILAGCDAGLKSGPPPGQQFQPLQLSVTPSSVDFTVPVGGPNPAAQAVQIQNAGPGTVTGLGIGTTLYEPVVGGWLTASIGGADFAPATLTISVDVAGMGPGLYFAIVPVVSTVTGVLERDVIVSLQITSAPIISISPDTVAITATVAGAAPGPQPTAVTNVGIGAITGMSVGTIIYDVAGSGWLSGSLNQPTAPATLSLAANTTGLAAGMYTAKVPVESSVPGTVWDTVNVVLEMTSTAAQPLLSVAPTSIVMVADAGGLNPAPTTAAINNSGGGSITNLTLAPTQYQPAGTWLSATLNQATAPATLNISANITGLPPGKYRSRVPVTAVGVNGSARNVTIDLTVNAAPSLVVGPQTVNFAGTIAQPPPSPQQVLITNGGPGVLTGIAAGPINYGPGATGWLQATVGATTSPTALILTVNPTGLAAGAYNATVPVSSTTPGMTPQIVVVNFDLASQTGFFNILTGDGQTGFVDSVLSEPLVARVTDASFNPVAGKAVVWQINNGGTLSNVTTVTSALGEVTASWKLGSIAGLQTVKISSAGLPFLTFTADAQLVPSGANQHPKEPPGYVRFAEHNMSSLPSYPRTIGGLAGAWYGYPQNDPDLAIINPDTTAPESPPNTLRTRFPAGFPAGSGPVNFGGWDVRGRAAQYRKVYISLWVKILGNDFENQLVGTKLGFVGGAVPTSFAAHNIWFFLKGVGQQAIRPSFKLELHQSFEASQNPPATAINLPQNVDLSLVMTAGVWHHWEAVFEMNTPGVEFPGDGIAKWWVDGRLIMSYTNMTYVYGIYQNGFWDFVWNPTWGGLGGLKTRDDFIAIDHLYISGTP